MARRCPLQAVVLSSDEHVVGGLSTEQAKRLLPDGKRLFNPSFEWDEILSEHVVPAGLEMRKDLGTGKRYARLNPRAATTQAKYGATGSREANINGAEYCQSDAAAFAKQLNDAATWGRTDIMRGLLNANTTACAVDFLSRPLCEASARGHVEICEMLLSVHADPLSRGVSQGVTPLHRAAGEGQEEVLNALLISCIAAGRTEALALKDDLGRTCLEVARENDFGPMASRVALAFEHGYDSPVS
jgi:hypothetical protein